jgi:hypothetical protein
MYLSWLQIGALWFGGFLVGMAIGARRERNRIDYDLEE